jgi:hypothetical protein
MSNLSKTESPAPGSTWRPDEIDTLYVLAARHVFTTNNWQTHNIKEWKPIADPFHAIHGTNRTMGAMKGTWRGMFNNIGPQERLDLVNKYRGRELPGDDDNDVEGKEDEADTVEALQADLEQWGEDHEELFRRRDVLQKRADALGMELGTVRYE